MIRAREIDVLVNLNGYYGRFRQGVFAQRPAPIQVNYLGFPGTLGADYIDYLIADAHVIPHGEDEHYVERIVRLPDSYQANDSTRSIVASTPTRPEVGLPEAGFVFCCFNNNYKITPDVFDVWMRLLRQVEKSVLWLFEDNADAAHNLRREAERRGVASSRIVFAPRWPPEEHLARHRLADLFVDTLPYNAHTTASDALWAGLPLVTVRGTTFAGRVASSLLDAAGLPELVTGSMDQYEALALDLATNPDRLAAFRDRLVANRDRCTLFDAGRFRRHIESAYEMMWQRFARGESPSAFDVAPLYATGAGK
jgi:protein O-GlcNAc transferase